MGVASRISFNVPRTNCGIDSNTLDTGAYISENTIIANAQVANKTLSPGISFGYNTVGLNINVAETYSLAGVTHLRAEPGFSNFEVTIPISSGGTLNIPAANNYWGIINLTGTSQTFSQITGIPLQVPFTLYPASGVVVTLTGTAYPPSANHIALPAASISIDGTQGAWIELQADPNGGGFSTAIGSATYL